jgi:hypothetical protein
LTTEIKDQGKEITMKLGRAQGEMRAGECADDTSGSQRSVTGQLSVS